MEHFSLSQHFSTDHNISRKLNDLLRVSIYPFFLRHQPPLLQLRRENGVTKLSSIFYCVAGEGL